MRVSFCAYPPRERWVSDAPAYLQKSTSDAPTCDETLPRYARRLQHQEPTSHEVGMPPHGGARRLQHQETHLSRGGYEVLRSADREILTRTRRMGVRGLHRAVRHQTAIEPDKRNGGNCARRHLLRFGWIKQNLQRYSFEAINEHRQDNLPGMFGLARVSR